MIALLLAACAPADPPLTHGNAARNLVLGHLDDVAWIRSHRRWLERFATAGDGLALSCDWPIEALDKLPGDEGLDALQDQLYGPAGLYAASRLARRPGGCEVLYDGWKTTDTPTVLSRELTRGDPNCVDTLHLTEPALLRERHP